MDSSCVLEVRRGVASLSAVGEKEENASRRVNMTPLPPLLRVRSAPRGSLRRMTIVVSAKEAPRAVERNRIRRRLRAALAEVGIPPSRPISLIGTASVKDAPFGALVESVRSAITSFNNNNG